MHQGPSKGLQDNLLSLDLAISPDTQSPILAEHLLHSFPSTREKSPPETKTVSDLLKRPEDGGGAGSTRSVMLTG